MTAPKVSLGFLHPGTYTECFAESKTALLMRDATSARPVLLSHRFGQMGKRCGAAGIVNGRNALAEAVLDHDIDWLFMVDSDMGFNDDTLERLLDCAHEERRPFVGALAFAHKTDGTATYGTVKFRPAPTVYRWHETDDEAGFVPWFDYPRNKVVSVAATGAACVLIHRTVLEKIRDEYGPVWFDTIRHPKGAHFSEDLAFCIRAAAVDVPIVVHTGIRTVHDKGGVAWDEAAYDEWRAAHPTAAESVA